MYPLALTIAVAAPVGVVAATWFSGKVADRVAIICIFITFICIGVMGAMEQATWLR